MNGIGADLRFAWRALRRNPGFTWVAVATLALGIGANTAIFSMVNAVVLDPLPFHEPDRLVMLWNKWEGYHLHHSALSGPDYAERSTQNRTLAGAAAFIQADGQLSGGGEPERVRVAQVTASLFPVLATAPALGRVFGAAEDTRGSDGVAVLSHGLWKRRFAGDPAVIGRTVRLDGLPRTVVGVMPKDFAFPAVETALWVPLALGAEQTAPEQRGQEWLMMIGRMKPGVTVAAVRAELDALCARIVADQPSLFKEMGWGSEVSRLIDDASGPFKSTLLFLLGAVGFLLLIACANIAHLMLARAAARRRELAVRAAIGASAGRLARQLLIESLLLASLGGGAGLLIGAWASDLLAHAGIAGLPRLDAFGVDGRVLLFTIAATLFSGLLFGLVPLMSLRQSRLIEDLKTGGLGAIGGGRRLRSLLIAGQTALTVVLLVGAGLMTRSLTALLRVDTGFDPRGAATLRTQLPEVRYPTPERQGVFFTALIERVAALPGVRAAGAISALPLTGFNATAGFDVEGRPLAAPGTAPLAQVRMMAGDYFAATGIARRRGSGFTAAGLSGARGEVIVDDRFARQAFPNEDPIGRRIVMGSTSTLTIVGVVESIRESMPDTDAKPMAYVPLGLYPLATMAVVARTDGDPRALAPAMRRVVRGLDPELPVYDELPLTQVVHDAVAAPRTRLLVFAMFAGLALLLAGVGIYGVVAYTVGQRTREIGVRMALGAGIGDVLRVVVGPSLALIALGSAVGLIGAAALGRIIRSQLFGVAPTDLVTYAVVPLVILGVALLACVVPARRAAKIDPVEALRFE